MDEKAWAVIEDGQLVFRTISKSRELAEKRYVGWENSERAKKCWDTYRTAGVKSVQIKIRLDTP